MEGWRTLASGWSPDDAPRVCLLFPGCLHLLPPLALLANLSSHKEPLPVWIKLSINCSVKPPGRLSSAVIEGFPPPARGQLLRRSVLPGAGVAGRPPCSPRGTPAFAPRLRAPRPSVMSRRPGFLVTQHPVRLWKAELPRALQKEPGGPEMCVSSLGSPRRGGSGGVARSLGPHGPPCWRTAWMLPAAFPHTPALVFSLVWPSL